MDARHTAFGCLLLLLAPLHAFGQWGLRFDIGLQANRYLVADPAGQLREAIQPPAAAYMLLLTYAYSDRLRFNTGIGSYALNYFPITFAAQPWAYGMQGAPNRLVVLPLQAEFALLRKRKWALSALGGPTLGIGTRSLGLTSMGISGATASAGGISLGTAEWRDTRTMVGKVGLLLDAGVRLSRRLGSRFELSVTYTRSWGFNDFTRDDISYSLNGGPSQEAVVFNRGSGGMVTLGVGYRLDRFMYESDSRLERND